MIEWLPTASALVVKVASPLPLSVAGAERGGAVLEGDGARRACPAPGDGVTVAVNVTDWPKTDGLALSRQGRGGARLVHDLDERGSSTAEVVTRVRERRVDVVIADSRLVVVNVASPETSTVADPADTPSTRNSTEPTGIAMLGVLDATWAVNVTDWPNNDGLTLLVIVVIVPTLVTVCEVVSVSPMNEALAAYVAVTVFAPAEGDCRRQEPEPPTRVTTQLAVPSETVMVSPGVAKLGGSAVTVTSTA